MSFRLMLLIVSFVRCRWSGSDASIGVVLYP